MVRLLGRGWDLARLRPEVCVALALDALPARAGGDEFDATGGRSTRRTRRAGLAPGAACALALLGKQSSPDGS
jgi:hypothetical protein